MSAKYRILGSFGLLAAAVGGYVAYEAGQPSPIIIQGEVEATRIDLAAQVPARVSDVFADFGDRVETGDPLVRLASPQLVAGLGTAQAALQVAEANRALVFSTRSEVIDVRTAELARAESALVLAKRTYDRVEALTERSTASVQRLDDATNSLNAAQRAVEAARANLELAVNGSSDEQKAVASAQVVQASAAVDRIRADLAELALSSPISGEVTARLAEPGELFSAGSVLMSIVDVDNAWFTFNIREDFMDNVIMGMEVDLRIPALGDRIVSGTVTAINAEGSYANWRATKATGDFDLRTFSVRVEPRDPDPALRPGMSAIVDVSGS